MSFRGSNNLFGDLPSSKFTPSLLFSDLPTSNKKNESSLPVVDSSSVSVDNNRSTTHVEISTSSETKGGRSEVPSLTAPTQAAEGAKTMSFIPIALQRKRPAVAPVNTIKSTKALSTSSSHMEKMNISISTSRPEEVSSTTVSNPFPVSEATTDNNITDCHKDDSNTFIESHQLIALHNQLNEGQVQMYDPHQPNDYLLVLQQRQQIVYKRNLEQQAQEMLKRQVALQKKIDEERKKIDQSGDYTAMIASRTMSGSNSGDGSMGRGRGRGSMQNLPSWLIKKQAEQQQQELGKRNHQQDGQLLQQHIIDREVGNDNNHRFCSVILGNIASPEEVDDELLEEVKEECEVQCGSVVTITVDEKRTSSIDILVTFANSAIAEKAVRIFQGRRFGNRVITAKLR